MKQNKRKAFTLTELLVVVIVLAVLAAVAMPKFRRTLETRRTTEAENMLSAIRTEQEKRCIMGYDYQTDATKLGALAKAGSSKHYDYSLQSTGATAATQGYNLQIPSYKDGRICCSGDGCEELNKNYPSCESITVAEDECAGEVSAPAEPEPEPEPVVTCSDRVAGTSFEFGSAESHGRCYVDTYYTCDKNGNEIVDRINRRGCMCDTQGYTYNAQANMCEGQETNEDDCATNPNQQVCCEQEHCMFWDERNEFGGGCVSYSVLCTGLHTYNPDSCKCEVGTTYVRCDRVNATGPQTEAYNNLSDFMEACENYATDDYAEINYDHGQLFYVESKCLKSPCSVCTDEEYEGRNFGGRNSCQQYFRYTCTTTRPSSSFDNGDGYRHTDCMAASY